MPRLSDDELREFLTRWLMEFGVEPVDAHRIRACDWYMNKTGIYATHYPDHFDISVEGWIGMKPAALDFIKGESHG